MDRPENLSLRDKIEWIIKELRKLRRGGGGSSSETDPISTATQTALANKLSIQANSSTGVNISFLTDTVYGTLATPETGNITADVTNAKLGVTNIIIHNSGTAPTFGSQF